MKDSQWKKLQEELKSIGPDRYGGPADPLAFKEKVLQEYKKRSRFEFQAKWWKRTAIAVSVCVAVWAGLFITPPMHHGLQDRNSGLSTAPSTSAPALTSNAFDASSNQMDDAAVVNQFFDLYLQRRTQEAQKYVAVDAKSVASMIPYNTMNPHMTGFTMQKLDGDQHAATYKVSINWGTYSSLAYIDSYQVSVQLKSTQWQIEDIKKIDEVTYDGSQQGVVARMDHAGTTNIVLGQAVQGKLRFFSVNPYNDKQIAFAVQGAQPVLYTAQAGAAPQKVATLPSGVVGEIFWMQNNLLAMNFQPQGTVNDDIMLFYDAKTGEQRDFSWLQDNLKKIQFGNAHIVHTLPGQKLRVRASAKSILLDVQGNNMSITRDPNSHDAASSLQGVKYDGVVSGGLPNIGMAVYGSNDTLPNLDALGVPANKRIDVQNETGLYVVNGSVQAYAIVGNEVQIEVCHDPNRVEVLAIPYSSLKQFSGKKVKVTAFDEAGNIIASRDVNVFPIAK